MFRVGLTGGIASGKSVISQLFSNLGVPVIDTDIISHELMQPGQAAYQQAVQHFGPAILNPDRSINRKLLRQQVFNIPEQKKWLEQMIHPLIRHTALAQMDQVKNADYVLLVVPLMFETGFDELVDHIIAIDCPPQTQKQRLLHRDQISEELVNQMISSQFSNQQRVKRADSVIHNRDDGDRTQAVLELHHKLLRLAKN